MLRPLACRLTLWCAARVSDVWLGVQEKKVEFEEKYMVEKHEVGGGDTTRGAGPHSVSQTVNGLDGGIDRKRPIELEASGCLAGCAGWCAGLQVVPGGDRQVLPIHLLSTRPPRHSHRADEAPRSGRPPRALPSPSARTEEGGAGHNRPPHPHQLTHSQLKKCSRT